MPELVAILNAKQDEDYEQRKFFAALQGVDIDKGRSSNGQDAWNKMKAKALSGNKDVDPNDITALQGRAAARAGFGIGNGLEYEVM